MMLDEAWDAISPIQNLLEEYCDLDHNKDALLAEALWLILELLRKKE